MNEKAIEAATMAVFKLRADGNRRDNLSDCLSEDIARAAIAAYEAALWEPIETAPRDGQLILAKHKTISRARMLYANPEWVETEANRLYTHWRPLPAPPESER